MPKPNSIVRHDTLLPPDYGRPVQNYGDYPEFSPVYRPKSANGGLIDGTDIDAVSPGDTGRGR